MTRLLRVEAPHFVAGAVWCKGDTWRCVDAAPIIRWMVGEPPQRVVDYLLKKGWRWEWL